MKDRSFWLQVAGSLTGAVDSETLDEALVAAPVLELLACRAWAVWLEELVSMRLDQIAADQLGSHFVARLVKRRRPVVVSDDDEVVPGDGTAPRCGACGSLVVRYRLRGYQCPNGCQQA